MLACLEEMLSATNSIWYKKCWKGSHRSMFNVQMAGTVSLESPKEWPSIQCKHFL